MASEEGSSQSSLVSAQALVLVTVAAIGTLVLGWIGLNDHIQRVNAEPGVHFGTGFFDIVYYDLQLFVLDSDPLGAGTSLPTALMWARFLAPATAAYAIALTARAVLARQLEQIRARRARRRSVIMGEGPAVTELARQVLAEGRRVVLVQSRPPSAPLPNRNVYRVTGDPRDLPVLRRAGVAGAVEVFAVSDDSAQNAQVAVSVLTLMQQTPRTGAPLRCYVQVDDWALLTALIRQELSGPAGNRARLELFNRHDRAARRILDRHPPALTGPRPEIIVVGRTELAEAVLSEIARWWTAARTDEPDGGHPAPLDVLLLVTDEKEAVPPQHNRSVLRLHPDTLENGLAARAAAPPTTGAVSYAYVCLDRDADGLRAGFQLLRALRVPHRDAPHIVVAVTRWAGLGLATAEPSPSAAILNPAALTTINVTEGVYDIDELRVGTNERLAQEIHAEYVELCSRRGDTPQTNASMRPWDELPEHLKESNRAQAQDIGVKLREIGCVVVPMTGDTERFAFTDAELRRLATLEHLRWMNRLIEQGWTWGPRRDQVAKKHPDLVDWSDLSEQSREADRNAVETIPELLASVGLQVVRLTPARGDDESAAG